MNAQQWQSVNDLFDKAIDLGIDQNDDASWSQFISSQGILDPAISKQARELLTGHRSEVKHFLDKPIAQIPSELFDSVKESLLDLEPGSIVDDFKIESLLGRGSFGAVYLARQNSLGRRVALKITDNTSSEAKVMADLEHEHIVPVYSESIDKERRRRLICMQHIAGITMQDLIKHLRGRPHSSLSGDSIIEVLDQFGGDEKLSFDPSALRCRIVIQESTYTSACMWIVARLAEALDFAHAHNILHLDVKPANILLDQYGRPKLTDFNVARSSGRVACGQGRMGGTLNYMSPEHTVAFRNNEPELVSKACDVYSLAIVLLELLTLEAPNPNVSVTTQVASSNLPGRIKEIFFKAFSDIPAQRFQSGAKFAVCLENAREYEVISASMPEQGFIGACMQRSPFWTVVGLIALPNLAGSLINILYNDVQIVSKLTFQQNRVFAYSLLPYNVIFYAITSAFLYSRFSALRRAIARMNTGHAVVHADSDDFRKKVLNSPFILVGGLALGWLPGSVIFPALIECFAGHVPVSVYGHFLVSFIMSWLISLTFAFLLVDYFVLVGVYPRLWALGSSISNRALEELRTVRKRHYLLQMLAGVVPLTSAILLVVMTPQNLDTNGFYTFKALVIGTVLLGVGGFAFALETTERVKAVMDAFSTRTN